MDFLKSQSEIVQKDVASKLNHSSDKQNNIPTTYDDVILYLESISLQYDGLIFSRDHKVLLRKDHSSLTDKVKIVSGGPAGMAPLNSGFVGRGMLTAAVLGDLNNGPSFISVLAALRILGKNHNPGVLVIMMNNLAERLTFSLACKQAALEGIKVMCVSVGEDCSGKGVSKAIGRKGSCGVLFLQKIAGAMAEDNRILFEIYYIVTALNRGSLGTVDVGIADNNICFSSGLNVEDKSKELNSISNIVKEALHYILEPDAPYSLHIGKSEKVAILVNNCGILKEFQMAIVTREVCIQIMANGIDLVRVYSGRFLTSRGENAFSISLLKINENLLKWLEFPVNVINWPTNINNISETLSSLNERFERTNEISLPPVESEVSIIDKSNLGPKFSLDEVKQMVKVLMNIIKAISDLEEYLNKLDACHNFGSTMKKFMIILRLAMDQKTLIIVTPYGLLNHLAELAARSMPGFAGAIFSVLFCSAAQSFVASSSHAPLCWCMWMEAAALARDSLCAYTKVELGDCTVFDALHPFVETFTDSNVECFNAAVQAAIKGVEEAACNHPEGLPDPGAYAIAVIFQTVFRELQMYLRGEGVSP